MDFSFSGLKSAVKRYIDEQKATPEGLTEDKKIQIAYEFEEVVTDILSQKLMRAALQKDAKMVVLAGGVSANTKLKSKIEMLANNAGIAFVSPKKLIYSMDNAAMVGIRAYYEYFKK